MRVCVCVCVCLGGAGRVPVAPPSCPHNRPQDPGPIDGVQVANASLADLYYCCHMSEFTDDLCVSTVAEVP